MKIKIVLIVALLSILMVGCTKGESESTFVEDGKVALESQKYGEAMKLLSSALEEDNADEYARAMYMQAMKMLSVEEYKGQGNYKKAIEELEAITSIKNGSSKIKSTASSELSEMKKLYEEQQEAEAKRKKDAKLAASKGASKASWELKKYEEESKKEDEEIIEEGSNQENSNEGEQQTPNIQNPTNQIPSNGSNQPLQNNNITTNTPNNITQEPIIQ
ncbi:tetratricopeptide repeat protein [Romboutsia sp. 1001713B170207_170306_H8]|uniref:tetratricopeptide repeat protein n=1 Tax=Romboutsia sp. 1001713B170207_170306_H8 TaxID=2787112 RepID=UPI000821C818|nr:tetratricopeptide repeat protein [Romboutsia sp. 1001713B170207_170306_H8]SCI11166.1 Uncharacterised protein [uncultured Clostridium sp.]